MIFSMSNFTLGSQVVPERNDSICQSPGHQLDKNLSNPQRKWCRMSIFHWDLGRFVITCLHREVTRIYLSPMIQQRFATSEQEIRYRCIWEWVALSYSPKSSWLRADMTRPRGIHSEMDQTPATLPSNRGIHFNGKRLSKWLSSGQMVGPCCSHIEATLGACYQGDGLTDDLWSSDPLTNKTNPVSCICIAIGLLEGGHFQSSDG